MQYISTRGQAAPVDFVTACMAGLAPDGGLYVPKHWPHLEPARPGETYIQLAARILGAFAGDSLPRHTIETMCKAAYHRFGHHSVAPLVQSGPNQYILELHHGPTLAFKDVAMQFIGELYEHVLGTRHQTLNIVCATSGDTGGAAASAFAGRKNIRLFILHPHGRVSPVQRQFMTTTGHPNIHNLAVMGDFDTCQSLVKAMFADTDFAACVHLSGVNSINWARIAAQSVYYAAAQAALGPERPVRFIVPSGNMGDAFAAYVAARCGLLKGLDLVCAVNENRALEELMQDGVMRRTPAVETPSPAMDISIPSNFERLMFEAAGRAGERVANLYARYAQSGDVALPETVRGPLSCTGIRVQSVSNRHTLEEIQRVLRETGTLICPHTAVGTYTARGLPASEAVDVVLATAHAAKFPETVAQASGQTPLFPTRCEALDQKTEQYTEIAPDLARIQTYISSAQ